MVRVSEFYKRENFTIDQLLNASIRGTLKKIVFILVEDKRSFTHRNMKVMKFLAGDEFF